MASVKMSFEPVDGAIEKVTRYVKKMLAHTVEDVGLQIYNSIAMGQIDAPYYSGSYISSWKISKEAVTSSYNVPTGVPNTYSYPRLELSLGVAFGQRVYITNAAPHARQVEDEGTPNHDGGWKTAAHAKNMAVMTYKFKMRP